MPKYIKNRTGGKAINRTLALRSRRSSAGQINSLWQGSKTYTVEYLVIGGGGGGGNDSGGGGGAGEYKTNTLNFISGNSATITVGGGGAIQTAGSNSIFSTITGVGGGRGADRYNTGGSGASGGGGGGTGGSGGSATAGNAGGAGGSGATWRGGGGGGGASATGTAAGASGSGNGGNGSASSISGSSVTYAGGGGGGFFEAVSVADGRGFGGTGGGGNGAVSVDKVGRYASQQGTANRGGGGGGGAINFDHTNISGAAGGSGVVIISYSENLGTLANVGAGLTFTTTTSGGKRIYSFTAGTDTIKFG